MWSIPRWAILLLGAALLVFGFAVHMGWLRDPSLAKADYVGNIDVSAEDAKLYRAVPFEWRVTSNAGSFTGNDTAWVRVDPSGERTVVCGWLRLDKGGNSIRATRWLSEARLIAGDLKLATGYCGKAGQRVPAGVGQPHVLLRELTVGGTAT